MEEIKPKDSQVVPDDPQESRDIKRATISFEGLSPTQPVKPKLTPLKSARLSNKSKFKK